MPHKDEESRRKYLAEWREKNRLKLRDYARHWSQANKDRRRESRRKHSAENVQRVREWRKANPKKMAAMRKRDRERHHEQRITWQRENRRKHPKQAKHHHLTHTFGIGITDYEAMLEKQGGRCAICKREECRKFRGKVVGLSVDHCHVRGHIRGLLCQGCNTGLGLFRDDPALLSAAIRYLRRKH